MPIIPCGLGFVKKKYALKNICANKNISNVLAPDQNGRPTKQSYTLKFVKWQIGFSFICCWLGQYTSHCSCPWETMNTHTMHCYYGFLIFKIMVKLVDQYRMIYKINCHYSNCQCAREYGNPCWWGHFKGKITTPFWPRDCNKMPGHALDLTG